MHRKGPPWTQKKVEKLLRLLRQGVIMATLVKLFGRDAKAIRNFTYYLRTRYQLKVPRCIDAPQAAPPLNVERLRKILRVKRSH